MTVLLHPISLQPVSLQPVSHALVAATHRARAAAAALCATVPSVEVQACGASLWEGALSKGDVDLLVRVDAGRRAELLAWLDARCERAQPENWTAEFASFTAHGLLPEAVGLQVVTRGSPDDVDLSAHVAALADPGLRAAYDAAKTHAAPLGRDGYWEVKDLFWRTRGRGPSWQAPAVPVLKILTSLELDALVGEGALAGAPVDVADGFVHLSTPEQVGETFARHFAGQAGLWLLHLDADALGAALRWEPSRGGALFPHLYAPLRLIDVCLARPWA